MEQIISLKIFTVNSLWWCYFFLFSVCMVCLWIPPLTASTLCLCENWILFIPAEVVVFAKHEPTGMPTAWPPKWDYLQSFSPKTENSPCGVEKINTALVGNEVSGGVWSFKMWLSSLCLLSHVLEAQQCPENVNVHARRGNIVWQFRGFFIWKHYCCL